MESAKSGHAVEKKEKGKSAEERVGDGRDMAS